MTSGLLELGEIMLTASTRQLGNASQNVANATTPGYRTIAPFSESLTQTGERAPQAHIDFSQGALRMTGAPLDLAISGDGFFRVRSGEEVFLTRNGQFERDREGRIVNAQGFALQGADGQDLIITSAHPDIRDDGIILEDGLPVGRIGIVGAQDPQTLEAFGGSLFSAQNAETIELFEPLIRQGMLEAANVELPVEMISMMSALRQAEIGARVIQAYDTLIGQSITTFGRAR